MTPSADELDWLAEHAVAAATEAAGYVARARPQRVEYKPGGESLASRVVTEIDRRSQAILLEALSPTFERFELGLLAEEREDDRGRLEAPCFWCIDPLDGTLSFVESTPGYSVSVALVARDGGPLIGVVVDPVEGTVMHAVRGRGIFVDRRPWTMPAPRGEVLSLFMDRSFREREDRDALLGSLLDALRPAGIDRLELGETAGAVMNACRVLTHPPAGYFKFPKARPGGGSLWDFAATACLFQEAGAVATDIEGRPLDLNRADSTFMNHRGVIFATDPGLARAIQDLRGVASR